MPICSVCGQEKPGEEFAFRWKALGKKNSACRECQAKRGHRWYEEHKQEHLENVRKRKEQARQEARNFIWDYLSNSICVSCGEYDPMVLQFDHVRGEKRKDISRMVQDGDSIKSIGCD